MSDLPKCFIVMPISVPEEQLGQYRDGADHFTHVLTCLHIPAVQRAGFEAIPPISDGSELIHAEIIDKLEKSEHVLCDMSCLNPNVFFEWGIRTSLNKPVAVVRDELVKKVPFDAGILNHVDYNSAIEAWDLEDQITKLAEHIRTAFDKSDGKNALWKHFGTKMASLVEAVPYKSDNLSADSLELILEHVESLGRQFGELRKAVVPKSRQLGRPLSDIMAIDPSRADTGAVKAELEAVFFGGALVHVDTTTRRIKAIVRGKQNLAMEENAFKIAHQYRYELKVYWVDEPIFDETMKL